MTWPKAAALAAILASAVGLAAFGGANLGLFALLAAFILAAAVIRS